MTILPKLRLGIVARGGLIWENLDLGRANYVRPNPLLTLFTLFYTKFIIIKTILSNLR
jgi:hypothetical protein